jgi:DNA-directed RNA polymerase subunit RPC12/RpoP
MTPFQPPTAYSDSIERPPCAMCGRQMLLSRIQLESDDFDKRTFECPSCAHEEVWIVKIPDRAANPSAHPQA